MFLEGLEAIGASQETIALAHGILLGDKSQLSPEMIASFRTAGMSHLLAVSGLHVGIIMSVIWLLFKPFEWLLLLLTSWAKAECRVGSPLLYYASGSIVRIAVIMITCIYVWKIGAPPSAVRATLMLSLCLLGWMFHRPTSAARCLLFAALLLIAWDPWIVLHVGFQLSFLSVGGILLFQPWLNDRDIPWVLRAVLLSIAAQSLTIPVVAFYFHQVPFLGWLQGLLVVPLMPLFVSLLLFVAITQSSALLILVEALRHWMGWVAAMTGRIETLLLGGHLYFYPTWYESVFAELAIIAVIILFRQKTAAVHSTSV